MLAFSEARVGIVESWITLAVPPIPMAQHTLIKRQAAHNFPISLKSSTISHEHHMRSVPFQCLAARELIRRSDRLTTIMLSNSGPKWA